MQKKGENEETPAYVVNQYTLTNSMLC